MKKNVKDFLINIGTGKDKSIKDYANFILKKLNLKAKIKFDKTQPDGTPRKILDTTKLNNLGWKFKTSLEEGLQITYKSFLKNFLQLRQ